MNIIIEQFWNFLLEHEYLLSNGSEIFSSNMNIIMERLQNILKDQDIHCIVQTWKKSDGID